MPIGSSKLSQYVSNCLEMLNHLNVSVDSNHVKKIREGSIVVEVMPYDMRLFDLNYLSLEQSLNYLASNTQIKFISQNNQNSIAPLPLFEVSLPNNFEKILDQYLIITRVKNSGLEKRLISKNSDGEYLYKDVIINIHKKPIYYKVFDFLFDRANQIVEYKEINRHISKYRSRPDDNIKMNRKILNSIHNGFYKVVTVGNKSIIKTNPDGKDLVEVHDGIGLRLNNPLI